MSYAWAQRSYFLGRVARFHKTETGGGVARVATRLLKASNTSPRISRVGQAFMDNQDLFVTFHRFVFVLFAFIVVNTTVVVESPFIGQPLEPVGIVLSSILCMSGTD